MARNITIRTTSDAINQLRNNSALYEFDKKRKYHSCHIRWIPISQQVRTYIRMSIFHQLLEKESIKEYLREEDSRYIRIYYTLSNNGFCDKV